MLQVTIDWIMYSVLGLDQSAQIVNVLNFFIYDSIKILLLLFFMVGSIGVLRTYISQQKIKSWLTGKKLGVGNIFASFFGAVTPFCSCSSIPIFLSFLEAGIPLGITFSFLITSPLVNEYLVAIMLGAFGWKITLAYIISGVLIGIVSGMILGRMNLEKYLVTDLISNREKIKDVIYKRFKERLIYGYHEAASITKKLWYWIMIGVGIGAIIHNYVPAEKIHNLIDKGGIFSVPLSVILGVPMYGSCAAIVPIALVLFNKGVPLGTALAFMMAVSALSLPEAIILRRAMKLKLIAIFFTIVTIGIIITGYLFNALQNILI